MLHPTRRRIKGSLVVAAVAAALIVAPLAANAAAVTVTIKVSKTLIVRAAPTLAAKNVGTLRKNQKVVVKCYVLGTTVRGTLRTTNRWDLIVTGKYISQSYVKTTRTIPRCATPAKAPVKVVTSGPVYIIGTVKSVDGRVNVRSAPYASGTKISDLGNGDLVALQCGVVGGKVTGTVRTTTQWDKTSSGYYISHAYVVTPTLTLCKGAAPIPPSTSVGLTKAQFLAAAVPAAQRGWREFGVPASVTIAQGILESGWGTSGLSSVDKNFFGIKCQTGRYGTIASGCKTYQTTECTKAGACFSTAAVFRSYTSMTNSFRDHGSFLKVNSRYKPAFTYTRSANLFIWNVWKAGYATDPKYYTKVTGVMAANSLYQYDIWK